MKLLAITLLGITIGLAGCASTNTGDPSKDARNAGLNAAAQVAAVDAAQILGQVAVNSLQAAVAKDTSNGQNTAVTQLEQAGVYGLYSVTGSQPVNLSNIITAYSDGKAKQTAKAAAQIQSDAGASTKVASAVASVISTATGAPPAK